MSTLRFLLSLTFAKTNQCTASKSLLLEKGSMTRLPTSNPSSLITALKLEGSKHVGCDPRLNSHEITVANEFRASWYLNPFAKVPFSHPKGIKSSNRHLSMSDPIYETTDTFFDGSFFSNTVHELRCKFNSPQAVLEEATSQKALFFEHHNFAKKLNQRAIDWAVVNAPAPVSEDVKNEPVCGLLPVMISLVRVDLELSHLRQAPNSRGQKVIPKDPFVYHGDRIRDHPIPSFGGKMYCKILSPAKVLDWVYTDSLRVEPNILEILADMFDFQQPIEQQHVLLDCIGQKEDTIQGSRSTSISVFLD